MENHPELFDKAKQYEKSDSSGKRFTWIQGLTLDELLDQKEEILSKSARVDPKSALSWQEQIKLDDDDDPACLICTL